METAVSVSDERDRLRFSLDGASVAEYIYRPDGPRDQSPRPYFDGLRTRRGLLVSESQPDDHPWHRGLSWALPVINDENFWGGPTYLRDRGYVQLSNNGEQRHGGFGDEATPFDFDSLGTTSSPASFTETLRWNTEAGLHILDERRTISVSAAEPDSWVLTFSTILTNVAEIALSFGSPTTRGRPNGGYGGLFWRGPQEFSRAVVISPLGTGNDDMRGQRAPWMGMSGYATAAGGAHSDAAGVTVVVVDGDSNLRTPPEWFARTEEYPCLCPAPFFSTEYTLDVGSELRLDYAVVIADGVSDPERGAALADLGRMTLARVIHPTPSEPVTLSRNETL
jgi:hypothetical protein